MLIINEIKNFENEFIAKAIIIYYYTYVCNKLANKQKARKYDKCLLFIVSLDNSIYCNIVR